MLCTEWILEPEIRKKKKSLTLLGIKPRHFNYSAVAWSVFQLSISLIKRCLSTDFTTHALLLFALLLRSTVNNFVGWPQGAVLQYNGYVGPHDGVTSDLLLSQPESLACVQCIQKESHCCRGQLPVSGRNQECCSLRNGETSSSTKN